MLRHGLAKRGAHDYLPLSASAVIPPQPPCSAAQRHAAHRLALLFGLVVLLSMGMSAFFKAPSTLWPYVALQLCALPLAMTLEGVGRIKRRLGRRRGGRCALQAPHLAPTSEAAHSEARPRARCARSWASGLWRLVLGISLVFWAWSLSPSFDTPAPYIASAVSADAPPLFIAANLYDSAAILPRFSDALLELVAMHRGRVFVSLYESNSPDGGKTERLLRQLDARLEALDVPHLIRTGEEKHAAAAAPSQAAAAPTRRSLLRRLVTKPRITKESGDGPGRIRFLAAVRNEALLPLSNGVADPQRLWGKGTRWSKVLWLNDVLFKSADMMRLLETQRGDYDVACAMDFGGALLGLYDT
jgi:hypothetical protein